MDILTAITSPIFRASEECNTPENEFENQLLLAVLVCFDAIVLFECDSLNVSSFFLFCVRFVEQSRYGEGWDRGCYRSV